MEAIALLMVSLFAVVAVGVLISAFCAKLYVWMFPLDADPDVWRKNQEQIYDDAKRRFYPFHRAGENALSAYESELTRQ